MSPKEKKAAETKWKKISTAEIKEVATEAYNAGSYSPYLCADIKKKGFLLTLRQEAIIYKWNPMEYMSPRSYQNLMNKLKKTRPELFNLIKKVK